MIITDVDKVTEKDVQIHPYQKEIILRVPIHIRAFYSYLKEQWCLDPDLHAHQFPYFNYELTKGWKVLNDDIIVYDSTWPTTSMLSITNRDKVVESVRNDLLQRSQAGIKKYNTTLERKDLKLKDWLQHAYEETLDQANYLKRAIMELDE